MTDNSCQTKIEMQFELCAEWQDMEDANTVQIKEDINWRVERMASHVKHSA